MKVKKAKAKFKLSKLTLDEVSLVDRPCNPGAEVVLFKRAPDPAGSSGNNRQEETSMTKEEIALMNARLLKSESMATMSDEEKKYLGKLPETKQAEFIKVKAEDRATFIKANPIAVDDNDTITVGDQVIRKGEVGAAVFNMLKAQSAQIDSMGALVKNATDALESVSLTSEAETRWPHTPGTPAEKAAILKSIKSMPKVQQDAMLASLDGADKVHKSNLDIIGAHAGQTGNDAAGDPNGPVGAMEQEIKKVMETEKLEAGPATILVMKRHPALYAAYDTVTRNHLNKPN